MKDCIIVEITILNCHVKQYNKRQLGLSNIIKDDICTVVPIYTCLKRHLLHTYLSAERMLTFRIDQFNRFPKLFDLDQNTIIAGN